MKVPKLALSERKRKFVREVGSVVLGVLIALGLGQIAESLSWASRRAEARDALRDELLNAAGAARERQLIKGCADRRLQQIGALLDRASATGRLPAVAPFRTPPMRAWHATTWETVVAGETASHFDVDTLGRLAYAYGSIDQLRIWNAEEKLAWASLSTLEGPERPLSPEMEVHLRDALGRARFYARLIPSASKQLEGAIDRPNILKPQDLAMLRTVPETMNRGVCTPLRIGGSQ